LLYSRDEPQYEIFKRAADGSSPEERVVTSSNDKFANSVSPDGKVLLFTDDIAGSDDIYATSPNPSDRVEKKLLIGGSGNQQDARFSPDGMWIAYVSNESGREEIYLAPYPANRGPARQQVSDAGGTDPRWGADGRTIYYGWSGRIVRARVNPRTGDIGQPERLDRIQPVRGWTMAPDGRLLLARIARGAEPHSIKVILNWASTLDAKN